MSDIATPHADKGGTMVSVPLGSSLIVNVPRVSAAGGR
jgi:hypothetical protein